MEHSLLHGLQLCGLIFALGGVLFQVLVLSPAGRFSSGNDSRSGEITSLVHRWITAATAAAAFSTLLDLFVQLAEIDGTTIYTGVSVDRVFRFLAATTVGNLACAKAILLALATGVALQRWRNSWLLALLLGAAFTSTLISHSAALPQNRTAAIAAQVVHIVGAAFWLGMLGFVTLATVRLVKRGSMDAELLSGIVARFSPYALASAILISLSGIYSSVRFIVSPHAVIVSAYGLTLFIKLLLLLLVGYTGFRNWREIRPQLAKPNNDEERMRLNARFLRLLELELSAGVLLILVAGILGAIAPPTEPRSAQLSAEQVEALIAPRLPQAHFIDPSGFVGAAERTDDDLRYAEFTHQWSGVFVVLLGLCWLGQVTRGPGQKWFARCWPFLLIPFGMFISLVADPEVWILHSFSIGDVLGNPQVLEHQIGAALVFVLALLGLRDGYRPAELRPLGALFPILVMLGSLMLLGHAHSNLGGSEELSSLVNMEHAIIGGCGLIAGAARWFEIRGLPGQTGFRFLWPGSIIALGLFMALFYRELTPVTASALALR